MHGWSNLSSPLEARRELTPLPSTPGNYPRPARARERQSDGVEEVYRSG